MNDKWQFLLNRLRERLWIKPLLMCLISVAGVFSAHVVDGTGLGEYVPNVSIESVESLLKIVASSMLVIATFAVASMVSAYASASSSATPRSFTLVVADDASQNALSTFIGAFIFSVVALVALMNGYYGKAGRFTLFVLTALVFAIVILSFVRWVDSIARLGRLGNTISKVERATARAFALRQEFPYAGGVGTVHAGPPEGHQPVYAESIGYLRYINMSELQERAEQRALRVTVAAQPGAFCSPNQPVAWISSDADGPVDDDTVRLMAEAFSVDTQRTYDHDPRFGLVVLSEIASRALSPAVNDPGTAIDVIGALVRLLVNWGKMGRMPETHAVRYHRVSVPRVSLEGMFRDAFTGIARDGAGTVEVAVRLQEALATLADLNDPAMREFARAESRMALQRAERALSMAQDVAAVQRMAAFSAT